jgi:RNA polymerase sigma-70 factor (ECF subfamily)
VALRQGGFTGLCDDVDLDRDRALVERCQSGDSAAFGSLYARYYERLLRFCLRRLNDPHEAEDAAQEAFARAWKALPNFAGERRFYPWLTVIGGNICTDMLRRRSRSTPTEDLELGAFQPVGSAPSATVDEVLLAAVDGELVHRVLDRLSVRHRHVLDMRGKGPAGPVSRWRTTTASRSGPSKPCCGGPATPSSAGSTSWPSRRAPSPAPSSA